MAIYDCKQTLALCSIFRGLPGDLNSEARTGYGARRRQQQQICSPLQVGNTTPLPPSLPRPPNAFLLLLLPLFYNRGKRDGSNRHLHLTSPHRTFHPPPALERSVTVPASTDRKLSFFGLLQLTHPKLKPGHK